MQSSSDSEFIEQGIGCHDHEEALQENRRLSQILDTQLATERESWTPSLKGDSKQAASSSGSKSSEFIARGTGCHDHEEALQANSRLSHILDTQLATERKPWTPSPKESPNESPEVEREFRIYHEVNREVDIGEMPSSKSKPAISQVDMKYAERVWDRWKFLPKKNGGLVERNCKVYNHETLIKMRIFNEELTIDTSNFFNHARMWHYFEKLTDDLFRVTSMYGFKFGQNSEPLAINNVSLKGLQKMLKINYRGPEIVEMNTTDTLVTTVNARELNEFLVEMFV